MTTDSGTGTIAFPSLDSNSDSGVAAIADINGIGGVALNDAEWNGGDWDITPVDLVGALNDPRLALDLADGNRAVAYQDGAAGGLRMAWHDGLSDGTKLPIRIRQTELRRRWRSTISATVSPRSPLSLPVAIPVRYISSKTHRWPRLSQLR